MSQATSELQPHLIVWNGAGALLAEEPLVRRMTSVAAADADMNIAELGVVTVFIEQAAGAYRLAAGGQKLALPLGEAVSFGGLRWLVALRRRVAAPAATVVPGGGGPLLDAAVAWMARPMGGREALGPALQGFLDMVVAGVQALNGMVILNEPRGTRIAVVCGIGMSEAEQVWSKMPSDLTESILRSKARLILPDGIREKVGGQPTVFVKDIRMVAGFPAIAEDRVLGILYLNFRSLVRELSPERMDELQAVSNVLGVVLQRAALREEMPVAVRETSGVAPDAPRLLVGASPQILAVYQKIERVAQFDVPVLVTGETGTGKELVSREIHARSRVATGPFVAVNAAALPENLVESELFGHARGAFTGAISDRIGLIERANGGTLFLDEIGELPLALQAKFLRVLQDQKVRRIGEERERSVSFRLVCATNRKLQDMVRTGTFREDLFFRISTTSIALPALRERTGDVAILANFFKDRFAAQHGFPEKSFSTAALAALESHGWSGNIRELQNVVQQACIMADGLVIRRRDLALPGDLSEPDTGDEESGQGLAEARDAWMRSYLAAALQQNGGNRVKTAKALGIGERTLFRYIEQLGMKTLLILCALWLAFPVHSEAAASPVEATQVAAPQGGRLERAETLFAKGEFAEAESLANGILVEDSLKDLAERTRLYLLKSRIEHAFGRVDGVRLWLQRLHAINPEARLDSFQDPPLSFAIWKELTAANPPPPPPAVPAPEPADSSLPQRIAEADNSLREHSVFWASLLPFGIGHFSNGQYVEGSAFLGGQVLLVFSLQGVLATYQAKAGRENGWTVETIDRLGRLEVLGWLAFLGLWGHELNHLTPVLERKHPDETPWVRYVISFAPFGVGQMKNGEPAKAAIFAGAETAFALLSILSSNSRFRTLGSSFFWGSLIYGAYDGWANHRWKPAEEHRTSVAVVPHWDGGGLGLAVQAAYRF